MYGKPSVALVPPTMSDEFASFAFVRLFLVERAMAITATAMNMTVTVTNILELRFCPNHDDDDDAAAAVVEDEDNDE